MKAIVKNKAKRGGLALLDLPIPKIGGKDLLIRIEKTAICGTDVHLYLWDEWAAKTLPVPSIIGHEFVGKVVEVGKEVKNFKKGDRVSGEGHLTCGTCCECLIGNKVLCPNTVGIGVHGDGCFAEYFKLPAENAFLIPADVSDEMATLFDPLGNAVHSTLKCDLVGKDVLIAGAGPIGLMSIAVAKKAGARYVIITDLNEYRLQLAKKMGATKAINIQKEDLKKTMKALGLSGFDVCLEMSGNSKAFHSLTSLAKPGGQIVLLGLVPAGSPLNWNDVIFKMLSIHGIYGREIFRTWFQILHLLQSGLDISPIITHRLPFQEFEKGFEAMISGKSGKVILNWKK